jgi:hypothetical protein
MGVKLLGEANRETPAQGELRRGLRHQPAPSLNAYGGTSIPLCGQLGIVHIGVSATGSDGGDCRSPGSPDHIIRHYHKLIRLPKLRA